MHDVVSRIEKAEKTEIADLLNALLRRYAVLFPEWEINVISLQRREDRNSQIDLIIQLLQKMKTSP